MLKDANHSHTNKVNVNSANSAEGAESDAYIEDIDDSTHEKESLFMLNNQDYRPMPTKNRAFLKQKKENNTNLNVGSIEKVGTKKSHEARALIRTPNALKRNASADSMSSINTHNRFEILAEEGDNAPNKVIIKEVNGRMVRMEASEQRTDSGAPSNDGKSKSSGKKVFVPAIIVNSVDRRWSTELLEEGFDFFPMLMPNCTKLKPTSLSEHALIINRLKKFKLAFHSYAPTKPKIFKAIAYNVPPITEKEFLEYVSVTGAPIVRAKMVQSSANNNYHVFVADFTRGNIDTVKLNQKHNIVSRHIIRWGPATKRRNSIIICRRCSGIGHGINWCHENICCIYCAGDHFPNECVNKVYDPVTKRVNSKSPKCDDDNHLAIDENCPMALREVERIKKQRTPNNTRSSKDFSLKNNEWFDLRKNLNRPKPLPAVYSSQTLTGGSYAGVVRSQASNLEVRGNRARSRSRSSARKSRPKRDSSTVSFATNDDQFEELLSLEEVTHIALMLANGYNQCHSIADQMKLIVNTIRSLRDK